MGWCFFFTVNKSEGVPVKSLKTSVKQGLALAVAALTCGASAQDLRVCMAENNAPMSYQVKREMRGLDVPVVQAIADHLKRPLKIIPFESELDDESNLSQEVNALLSSDICDLVSGFPLIEQDLGASLKPVSRTPDYPGAKRFRERPWIKLGTLVASDAYQGVVLTLAVADERWAKLTLQDVGQARLGATAGTLSGAATMLFNSGQWRPRVLNLSRDDDPLQALKDGKVDAVLVSQSRLDNWQRQHPTSKVRSTGYQHPLRMHLGLVALQEQSDLLAQANQVIQAARSDGRLQQWAQIQGVTYVAPLAPEVRPSPDVASLSRAN